MLLKVTKEEYDFWYARALILPFGWRRSEVQTARVVAASRSIMGGSMNVADCYINYLEELPEDDDELMSQVEEFKQSHG